MYVGRDSIIDESCEIADDVWIGNWVHIRYGAKIGSKSELRDHVFLGPEVTIGKNSRIYQFCNIGMGTTIGDDCFIAVGTYTADDKALTWPEKDYENYREYGYEKRPPVIEDKVRVGMGVRILPGVILREGCRIGMGAVVTKSTEPWKTYAGVPAREMK